MQARVISIVFTQAHTHDQTYVTRHDLHRLQVEGMELLIEDMVGATGLELKSDPGVPFVYAGFAGMMVRRCKPRRQLRLTYS